MPEETTYQLTSGKAAPSSTHLKLRCAQCGTRGEYEVGVVFHEAAGAEEPAKERYSFSHYFRCHQCHSAGPWEVVDTLKLLALRARAKVQPGFAGLHQGHFASINGVFLQTPAMAEDYLLKRLQAQPRDTKTYRELGHIFRLAEQNAKAGEWYAKALALDPHDLQAHFGLFGLAMVANDVPARLLHASLLVRDLLAGYPASTAEMTATIAAYLVEDLRAAPNEFRQHFLGPGHKRSKRPEDVFIRTLLTQDGEEEDILHDAAQRLLDGVPEPSVLSGDAVITKAPTSAPPPSPKAPALELVPSLAHVVQTAGLDPQKVRPTFSLPDRQQLQKRERHEVSVSDGQKTAVWWAPPLSELFPGNQAPPPHLDYFPKQYVPYFAFVESHLLTICDVLGDRTDQEMEEIYAALRRRPDSRSLGAAHNLMWQVLAVLLGGYVLSAAEYEALVGTLLTSVRHWATRPISRNYLAYLRRKFGHARPEKLPPA